MTAATLETRKNRTALLAFGGALAMLGLGYAAVPLYQLFCQEIQVFLQSYTQVCVVKC